MLRLLIAILTLVALAGCAGDYVPQGAELLPQPGAAGRAARRRRCRLDDIRLPHQ